MIRAITVKQLQKHCEAAIKNGYGDKKILISRDDEGNEYHELFFSFTPADKIFDESIYDAALPHGVTSEKAINEYIILG